MATQVQDASPGSRGQPGQNHVEAAAQAATFGGVLIAGILLATSSFRLPLICPLRLFTGIPCPLCGLTTGTVSLLKGDFLRSISTNPISPVVVAGAVAGFVRSARMWVVHLQAVPHSRWVRVIAGATLAGLLAASWISQLIRFEVF